MQQQNIIISADLAKEKLNNAILRLDKAIAAKKKKYDAEEKIRREVIKELDTYIVNIETLLNPKKK